LRTLKEVLRASSQAKATIGGGLYPGISTNAVSALTAEALQADHQGLKYSIGGVISLTGKESLKDTDEAEEKASRRRFLRYAAGAAAAAALAGAGYGLYEWGKDVDASAPSPQPPGASERIRSPTVEKPLPPGQYYVDNFPIYDIAPHRPSFDPDAWTFRVWGAVDDPVEWTWDELLRLPTVEVVADFHCVTRWSMRAQVWEGIPTRNIVDLVQPTPDVVQAMAHCSESYATNVPLEYLRAEDTLMAFSLNGEPLTPQHGAPLRLVVPQLYGYKSAKYLKGFEFQTEWKRGYWETWAYDLIGDPWEK